MELLSTHCGGGWIDATRAGGQLNGRRQGQGRRQGVSAGLKTVPAVGINLTHELFYATKKCVSYL